MGGTLIVASLFLLCCSINPGVGKEAVEVEESTGSSHAELHTLVHELLERVQRQDDVIAHHQRQIQRLTEQLQVQNPVNVGPHQLADNPAFSAFNEGGGLYGPGMNVIFETELIDTNSWFDGTFFNCSVKGIYYFTASAGIWKSDVTAFSGSLSLDGIAMISSAQDFSFAQVSQSKIMMCEQGQLVGVAAITLTHIWPGTYGTFSGFLIQQLN